MAKEKERKKRVPHSVDTNVIKENAAAFFSSDKAKLVETFAITLNTLMEEKGIDQEKMSDELQISSGAISNYRNGKAEPGLTRIIKIANYLDVDCSYLMTGISAANTTLSKDTGLSDGAIELLRYLNKSPIREDKRTISFLNLALPNPKNKVNKDFPTETIFSLIDQYIHTGNVKRIIHEERSIPDCLEAFQIQEGIRQVEEKTVAVQSSGDIMELLDIQSLYRAEKMKQITKQLDYYLEEKQKNGKA